MSNASIHELIRDPVAFLARVEAGESMTVLRDGRPVVELRPVAREAVATPRPHGLAAGAFGVPADFDAPLPDDVLQAFEGR